MKEIYVFVGPTISIDEANNILKAKYLPPVSEGDVCRVAKRKPLMIGIIDGFFEHTPSVWHKEILWAMKEGIHVYGSASMGALRAAELYVYGMTGIGQVFEQFRSGVLEDDDEVAIIHGPQQTGYKKMSEAMINIRYSLNEAEKENIIDNNTHSKILHVAKNLFYPNRQLEEILRLGLQSGCPLSEIKKLDSWLKQNKVDVKHDDAALMLETMCVDLNSDIGPKTVKYSFENTETWERAFSISGELFEGADFDCQMITLNELTNEALLERTFYQGIETSALLRLLLLEESKRQEIGASSAALTETINYFLKKLKLYSPSDLERWLSQNLLNHTQFLELMRQETMIGLVKRLSKREISKEAVNVLKLNGIYHDLMSRIHDKKKLLTDHGMGNINLNDLGITIEDLTHWFVGGDSEICGNSNYLHSLDSKYETEFSESVLKEYYYLLNRERHDKLKTPFE